MHRPAVGDTVEDTASRRVGKIMGHVGPFVQLRPIGGGREWEAEPSKLRRLTLAEALSAGVAEANARSRGEKP
ncbi:hypothetical protein PV377_17325 [Streptomyces ipomoeae]|nr:hypothetical protein [Streptomyces ipomoeae]MDX2692973.1 hypothetical protein [Streptomyces ipomoeae]MDX2840705.1 hypothetical protein [Streptomyces ipomoeae]MDX2939044.1 hypothetical protein [Streptomyces ipomoeae]TQE25142.1 hypothetical protein SipoB123_16915 [Streptomyces ipomoeae]